MNPVLAAIAVSAGEKIVNNAISYYTNKNSQKQAQANTRKNMQEQQALEDESWNSRIVKSTKALRDAGLSPALATGQAQGAAAVTPTASPMPQVGNPGADFASMINSMELNESQKELNEAAASKAQAEADKINLETEHAHSKDYFINSHLGYVLQDLRNNAQDEFTREFAQSFIEANSSKGGNIAFDYGALDAFEELFYHMQREKRSHLLEQLTNHFDRKVMSMQLTNGAAYAVAQMPKDQRKLMYKQMMHMDAMISKLASDVSLNDKQKEMLTEQIKKVGQEIQSMFHNDPVAMYNAGEIGDLAVKLGFEGTSQFMHGAGFGIGYAGATKFIGGKPSNSMNMPNSPDVFKGSGFSPEKIPTKPKGKEPSGLKVHRLREELNKMKSDGTKYFKPEVYRKKLDELERAKYGIK